MNENRLSMMTLNRNHSHLIVKRFLARKHQMRFMPLSQLHSGRKKGGESYLAHHWQDQPDAFFKSVESGFRHPVRYPLTGFSLGLLFDISNWSIK
jgi:hypothetical protein